jgi:hypothetical protein
MLVAPPLLTVSVDMLHKGLLLVNAGSCLVLTWLVVRALMATDKQESGQGRRIIGSLAIHMAPVILLSTTFPIIADELGTVSVASVPLERVILAAAVVTPWLSQAFSAPFYLEYDQYDATSATSVARHVLSRWPLVALGCAPIAFAAALVETMLLGWSLTTGFFLGVLLLFNVLFGQSLTPAYMRRSSILLGSAWVTYAVTLLAVPTVWWLPPVAGMLSQLLIMLWQAGGMPARRKAPRQSLGAIRGALSASAIWALPCVIFLRQPLSFPAAVVFASLIPAVMIYQIFFLCVSDNLSHHIDALRRTLDHDPAPVARRKSTDVFRFLRKSALALLLAGVLQGLAAINIVAVFAPQDIMIFTGLVIASLAGSFATLHGYKLDLLQRRRLSLISSAGVLAAVAGALVIGLSPAGLLTVACVASVVGAALVVSEAHARWRSGVYELFWSKALGA